MAALDAVVAKAVTDGKQSAGEVREADAAPVVPAEKKPGHASNKDQLEHKPTRKKDGKGIEPAVALQQPNIAAALGQITKQIEEVKQDVKKLGEDAKARDVAHKAEITEMKIEQEKKEATKEVEPGFWQGFFECAEFLMRAMWIGNMIALVVDLLQILEIVARGAYKSWIKGDENAWSPEVKAELQKLLGRTFWDGIGSIPGFGLVGAVADQVQDLYYNESSFLGGINRQYNRFFNPDVRKAYGSDFKPTLLGEAFPSVFPFKKHMPDWWKDWNPLYNKEETENAKAKTVALDFNKATPNSSLLTSGGLVPAR